MASAYGSNIFIDSVNIATVYSNGINIYGATGSPGITGATISNSLIGGAPLNGIILDGINGVLMNNCHIETSTTGINMISSGTSTIRNCVIQGCTGNGITLDGLTSNVNVINNTISKNYNGIELLSGSSNNVLVANNLTNNIGTGILDDNLVTTNSFTDNKAITNATNYSVNVPFVVAQGGAFVMGANMSV